MHGQADPDNFGATHPAVQARAVMGRVFLDAIDHAYTAPTGHAQVYATSIQVGSMTSGEPMTPQSCSWQELGLA